MSQAIMRINVHYYAALRERRGLDQEDLDVDDPSLRALYDRLQTSFGLRLSAEHVRPAVNDEFCDWDRPLCEGDRVVFLPPVAGG